MAADSRCRPVARLVTPGQAGDCPEFIPLMESISIARRGPGRPRTRPGTALADKAYSSAANRAWLRRRRIHAVIPVKEDQKKHRRARGRHGGRPPGFDSQRYKDRNVIERCFARLKQNRAVACRYDKRQIMFQGTIDIASIRIWLRDPVPDLRDTPHRPKGSLGEDLLVPRLLRPRDGFLPGPLRGPPLEPVSETDQGQKLVGVACQRAVVRGKIQLSAVPVDRDAFDLGSNPVVFRVAAGVFVPVAAPKLCPAPLRWTDAHAEYLLERVVGEFGFGGTVAFFI